VSLVSGLLHETVENIAVALNLSICFSEDGLAKCLLCAKKGTESQAQQDLRPNQVISCPSPQLTTPVVRYGDLSTGVSQVALVCFLTMHLRDS